VHQLFKGPRAMLAGLFLYRFTAARLLTPIQRLAAYRSFATRRERPISGKT